MRKEYNTYMRVYMKKYNAEHPKFYANILKRCAERWLATKTIVLKHYGKGHRLQCCWRGCTVIDVDMLSIDHVNDNGAEHRERITKGKHRTGGGINFYQWLLRNAFPDGYQTLCHNHQWKKEILRRKMKRNERMKL
jgi:hypothetical protein